LVLFMTWDEAKGAEIELRAAGYSTRMYTNQIDDYSNAAWMDVGRSSEDTREDSDRKELKTIIDPFGGDIQEWITEEECIRQAREEANRKAGYPLPGVRPYHAGETLH